MTVWHLQCDKFVVFFAFFIYDRVTAVLQLIAEVPKYFADLKEFSSSSIRSTLSILLKLVPPAIDNAHFYSTS